MSACTPRFIVYLHICLEEDGRVKIVERSSESLDSQGKPLLFAKTGLPTRSKIEGVGYTVEIMTPLNATPVMFIKAVSETGQNLVISGTDIMQLDPKSGMARLGHLEYSYKVGDKRSGTVDIDISNLSGQKVGHERMNYTVRSRGRRIAIDAL
jgi:hypothetical protein